jgi:thymidylate synthase ThyX
VRETTPEERSRILDEAVLRRGKHDQVGRAWETTSYTFDVLVDYGAFRDIQRHRMATQINQPVSTAHGYVVPPEIDAAGFGDEYRALMERARETFDAMAEDMPEEAQYVVPLAFRKRTLFTMNLRAIHHMVQLRSGPAGHPSYRRLANHLLNAIRTVHPSLAAQVRHTPFE